MPAERPDYNNSLTGYRIDVDSQPVNTWQRIAGSFGIGLIAALYAAHARAHGPVAALRLAGVVLALIAAAGMLAALALPAVRNTALARD